MQTFYTTIWFFFFFLNKLTLIELQWQWAFNVLTEYQLQSHPTSSFSVLSPAAGGESLVAAVIPSLHVSPEVMALYMFLDTNCAWTPCAILFHNCSRASRHLKPLYFSTYLLQVEEKQNKICLMNIYMHLKN